LGAVVAALVVKATEKTGEHAAGGVAGAVGRLVESVRSRFTGDPEATAALERVEDPPASEKHLARLSEAVERHAEDPAWAAELEQLVRDAQDDGVDVQSVMQWVWGDHNTTLANITGSTITIQPASGLIGAVVEVR
jgi:hypothetical protein